MYEQHFGLSRKPFNATPDPRFLYTNHCYQEAYATLLYGIQERKGFIALIGEVGTGKTTLLRRLMDSLSPATKVVFVYNAALTFDELVEFICGELEIPVGGLARVARLQALNKFLIAEAKRGGTLVLLLDEAQNLSAEALENLRLISNLETATDKLVQIVLVGQPELETKLADPALRQVTQRIPIRFRLEPLDDSEVEPYIDYRLRVVGRSRKELFADSAIRTLLPYVNGIPRLINVVCDNALVLAYATDRKQVTGEMIDGVAADLRLRRADSRVAPRVPDAEPHREFPDPSLERSWGRALLPTRGLWWGALGAAAGGALALVAVAALGSLPDLAWRPFSLAPLKEPSGHQSGPPSGSTAHQDDGAAPRSDEAPPSVVSAAATPVTEPAERTADEGNPSSPGLAKIAGRKLIVPAGGTISEIVFQHYGRYSSLALDLIQELNPDVRDLDVVAAGQPLWLPPLDLNALLRRQADGSYRLIVSSQPGARAAASLAQAVRARGYTAAVTTRRVASDKVLYRVEIHALKTRAAAARAWEAAKRLDWVQPRADAADG
jgi:type II secretory pathway predicted ATPase ExeA